MLPAFFLAGFVACVIGALLILVLIVHLSTRRYTAAQRYRAFLAGIARQRAQLIRDGHLQETTPGGLQLYRGVSRQPRGGVERFGIFVFFVFGGRALGGWRREFGDWGSPCRLSGPSPRPSPRGRGEGERQRSLRACRSALSRVGEEGVGAGGGRCCFFGTNGPDGVPRVREGRC